MPEFDYKQRPATDKFDKGHEDLYGKRCIKHGDQTLPCKKCAKLDKHFNKGKNKAAGHDEKRVAQVNRIMDTTNE